MKKLFKTMTMAMLCIAMTMFVSCADEEPPTPGGTGSVDDHDYVDLGLPSGTLWATCNVGATNPEDYGDYFAWGEIIPYYVVEHSQDNPCNDWRQDTITGAGNTNITGYDWHTYSQGGSSSFVEWATPPYDSINVLKQEQDAARKNWGGKWRMPTRTEMEELRNSCTWTWTTQGGNNGYSVKGPGEYSIFLPAADYRLLDSIHRYDGSKGVYWTCSLCASGPSLAYGVYFSSGNVGMNYDVRYIGKSVRPVHAPLK